MNFLQRLWANTDKLTKWIQVVALAVAAYWAYTKFQLGEAPSLKPNAWVDASLSAEPSHITGDCYIEFQVIVENVGKVEFDVKKVRIRAWQVALPKSISSSLRENYFDIDSVQQGDTQFEQVFPEGNLVRHYLTGNQSTQTYTWAVKPSPRAVYLFRADIGNDKEFFQDYGRQWSDNICVESKTKSK